MGIEHYGQAKVFKVVRVSDGDTFTAVIAEWPVIIGHNIRVRISNVGCPELDDPIEANRVKAERARDFLRGLLTSAKEIRLERIKRDKYFRILAEVKVDGHDVGAALWTAGFADYHNN